jgi:transcriptional activator of cad operon
MNGKTTSILQVGEWRVDPASGRMDRNGEVARLDVRTMRLLLCLAERAGQVVSIDDLISHVWAGVAVSPDSVYQAVTSLRRQLGDDSRQPAYIETAPRLGYRMIAAVRPCADEAEPVVAAVEGPKEKKVENRNSSPRTSGILWAATVLVAIAALGFALHARLTAADHQISPALAAVPQQSIGVLPFLDLTEGMHNEEFADGMTEEIIDKLSKIPGVSVPSATASFYYKGKDMPVGEIAKGLNVAYLLDGSVRKAAGRVRIAARLVRAENSYVIWTNTYDRPVSDLIMVQDDIAGEVAKALQGTVASPQARGKPQ